MLSLASSTTSRYCERDCKTWYENAMTRLPRRVPQWSHSKRASVEGSKISRSILPNSPNDLRLPGRSAEGTAAPPGAGHRGRITPRHLGANEIGQVLAVAQRVLAHIRNDGGLFLGRGRRNGRGRGFGRDRLGRHQVFRPVSQRLKRLQGLGPDAVALQLFDGAVVQAFGEFHLGEVFRHFAVRLLPLLDELLGGLNKADQLPHGQSLGRGGERNHEHGSQKTVTHTYPYLLMTYGGRPGYR